MIIVLRPLPSKCMQGSQMCCSAGGQSVAGPRRRGLLNRRSFTGAHSARALQSALNQHSQRITLCQSPSRRLPLQHAAEASSFHMVHHDGNCKSSALMCSPPLTLRSHVNGRSNC